MNREEKWLDCYEEIVALMENEEVQAMPSYPDDGSVKIVDGVIVVKIME